MKFESLTKRVFPLATLVVLTVPSTASAEAGPVQAPPSFAKPFAGSGDIILAAKSEQSLANGIDGAVIVVRHSTIPDRTENPCELIVVMRRQGSLAMTASNRELVDCRYNESARNAPEMGLNNDLVVSSNQLSFSNELSKGGSTYTFSYDATRSSWHLTRVDSTSVATGISGEVEVHKAELAYPDSIPWLSIDQFDPKALRQAIKKNSRLIQ